jgi:hypothetical protein
VLGFLVRSSVLVVQAERVGSEYDSGETEPAELPLMLERRTYVLAATPLAFAALAAETAPRR